MEGRRRKKGGISTSEREEHDGTVGEKATTTGKKEGGRVCVAITHAKKQLMFPKD